MFLTMSANEIRWPHLLKLLHRLNSYRQDITVNDLITDLDASMRSYLVNKLVNVIISLMGNETRNNPFGKYRILDYCIKIEFQHRGSPHAHCLLWLEHDPIEVISEKCHSLFKW